MFELIHITNRTYIINSPAKIGLFCLNEHEVILIDSGNDKEAGRKIKKICDENQWQIKAILNTHSNADHIGGNHYLINQTQCIAYANKSEVTFTQYPYLESSFLYGGFPPNDLRHKFLCAPKSDCLDLSHPSFPHEIEVINLPGHFFHMVGYKTPDNIIFLADALASSELLDKYALFFIYDVKAFLDTLDQIEKMEANYFVPAHAQVVQDIKPLVMANRKKVHEIIEVIIEYCTQTISFEDLLQAVFKHYHLLMNFEQNVLVGSTLRSYCSYLKNENRLDVLFIDSKLYWIRTNVEMDSLPF